MASIRRTTPVRPSGALPAPTDSMRLSATTMYPEAYSVSWASTVAIEQFSMMMR
ncbi:hypothetical protein SMICM17S_06906 [Streptomyces microflavus]